MRRSLLALAAALFAVGAAPEPVTLRQRPIERFGNALASSELSFLGGLSLSGPRDFGGLSGIITEGDKLLAVTDAGHWFAARMVLDGDRLVRLADTRLWPRLDVKGKPIDGKTAGDAEALARVDGRVVVMNEREGRLLSYPINGFAPDAAATPLATPASLHRTRGAGREALATLPDGTLIAFSEGRIGERPIPAWRIPGRPFSVARDGPWQITGAAALPSGDVILLERRYEGGLRVGARLRMLAGDEVATADGPLDGPILIEADFGDEIDNMEGIAAEDDGTRIVLTLVSDDNFSIWQRTLVLRFALERASLAAPVATIPVPRQHPLR